MKGLWDYSKVETPRPYGNDDVTYRKAMTFMADCNVVEDWGCGMGYARKFCTTKYVGVDGSWSKFADVVADLREYTSQADGILLRHVLEHNHDWRPILRNAIKSFTKKLALVIFTPFQETTKVLAINKDYHDVPDIGFRKGDLLEELGDLAYSEQSLRTATQYNFEHVFYVIR
jgi:hypothetical protein